MLNYNKTVIIGRLTKDPEIVSYNGDKKMVKIRVAFSNRMKKGNEWVDESCYLTCVAFMDSQVKAIGDYFHKGRPILVEGQLRLNEWTDKDGVKRSDYSLLIKEFGFVDKKPGDVSISSEEPVSESGFDSV